jgi:hypothetical protein
VIVNLYDGLWEAQGVEWHHYMNIKHGIPRIKISRSDVVLGALIPNAILDQPHIYHVKVHLLSIFLISL